MTQNGNTKNVITCPACQQRFSVTAPVPEQPMNALKVSVVAAPHEKPIHCPNVRCGAYFVWAIQAVEIAWNILRLTPEQSALLSESRIIVPEMVIN